MWISLQKHNPVLREQRSIPDRTYAKVPVALFYTHAHTYTHTYICIDMCILMYDYKTTAEESRRLVLRLS